MSISLRRAARAALTVVMAIVLEGTLTTAPVHAYNSQETKVALGTTAPLTGYVNKFKGQDSGSLAAINPTGKHLGSCPLKHTSVSAKISGYVARVEVKQLFVNPFKEKIEAIYTFPLSDTGAVDEMLMRVGQRTVHGTIKRKEEARQMYEKAKSHGHVASLLDQERPNIFTQSVANIKPGETVEITLRYVDLLPYEAGSYAFAFPTVVGPRFNPGNPISKEGTGWSADTDQVPDASKITPPITAKGTRAGHDLSLSLSIDAGVPISNIESKLHEITINRQDTLHANVQLKDKGTIPNKDFVLTWQVAGETLKSGYLAHRNAQSGYFTVMVLPPKRVTPETAAPKEMIFLIDCSGSQSGAPLDKAKETLRYIVNHMNPNDTFQILAFNNQVAQAFPRPQTASATMRREALVFIDGLNANGGTWMAPAVEKACSIPADAHRLRIVTFMTDGYVGNDFEILGMVRKLRGTSRWFTFGTGNSVNRMLIDGIAREGGGEPDYVLLNSSGEEVAKKFYARISSPILTDVKYSFQGLSVKETFPNQISDVWAERPLYIKGRYEHPAMGWMTISGFAGGKPWSEKIAINLPEKESANAVLAPIWARAKVDRLMAEDWFGAQGGQVNKELKEEIIQTALAHHIMTQYTSFVAVEEKITTEGGKPKTITVPVEMPDGVSYKGIFGKETSQLGRAERARSLMTHGAAVTPYSNAPKPTSSYPSPMVPGGYAGSLSGPTETARPVAMESKVVLQKQTASTVRDQSRDDRATLINLKLDQNLQRLQERSTKAKSDKSLNGLKIVNGQVLISIQLSELNSSVLKELKEIGFKVVSQKEARKTVTGWIEVSKLETLTHVETVKFIRPYTETH